MKTPIEILFELLSGTGWSGDDVRKDLGGITEVRPSIDPNG